MSGAVGMRVMPIALVAVWISMKRVAGVQTISFGHKTPPGDPPLNDFRFPLCWYGVLESICYRRSGKPIKSRLKIPIDFLSRYGIMVVLEVRTNNNMEVCHGMYI